ncbi:TetR/AcrR family transcriptional regulator [Rugamonas apoptosis]|uniref:TetR/AcrR family transcriptional regulator n=1 Tax=Rugamonas apoptosis TaxID=2758570 RepID=A0A7W2FDU4_9BURK|nr:TetR/AcrR family transcriptional regulator [Rugamonas apoptosis]MBA5689891.1 TetR/AcrR family transcriptional regulator [Rugamonas apoptosis]
MKQDDHRVRVGAERRQKMRRHLIESALKLFAERGLEEVVIDDVIVAASVSRGTFYYYFKTNAELLAAVVEELGNELMQMIESVVGTIKDPAELLAQGLRLYLHTVQDYPTFAGFLARAGLHAARPTNLVFEYIPRHLERGMLAGRFKVADVPMGLDIVAGIALAAVCSIVGRPVPADFPEQATSHILMGLGMTPAAAGKLVQLPLVTFTLPSDSLLVRTHAMPSAESDRSAA